MKEIVYATATAISKEPYTHRLIGNILAAAAKRNYSISLRVPDTLSSLERTHLLKLIRNSTNSSQFTNFRLVNAELPLATPGSVIFFAGSLDYWRLFISAPCVVSRYKKVFWLQGFESEESYMKHNNSIRRFFLMLSESYAIKASSVIICPSDAMVEMLLKSYPHLRYNNFITIPNLADSSSPPARDSSLWGFEKPPRFSLGYLGGLSQWQCFEESCHIVAKVQNQLPDVWFLVLTRDIQQAEEIIKREGVKQYRIRTAATDEISRYVTSFDYGFMLRREHLVNYVACPMKWLEYWQCGVPLIMTSAIRIVTEAPGAGLNCIVDIENIQAATNSIIALASQSEIIRQQVREIIVNYVEDEWTWSKGFQAVEDVFNLLETPHIGARFLWKHRFLFNSNYYSTKNNG